MIGFFSSSTVHKKAPAGLVPKCGACGLFRTCNTPKMKPYGEGRSKVLVVGEAPGETEDDEGRPFIGKAGQYLRDVLDRIDVDLDKDALTTNAVICHPQKNATPDSDKISYCRPNLIKTIQEFQPNVVIPLGRVALESVLHGFWKEDIDTLERWVGWRIPAQPYWICPTYHPSYLIRTKNPAMERLFEKHLAMAFDIQHPPPTLPDFRSKVEILYDEDEIHNAVDDLEANSDWVAVDYETNCLKPEYPGAAVYSFAACNDRRIISFPFFGASKEAIRKLLHSKRCRKIASNAKFEERWTANLFGYGVVNWGWDTMLAAHCLDNRRGICSLKFQAFVRMGVPIYNTHIEPFLFSFGNGHYNRIKEINMHDLLLYGGMDAVLEYWLADIQRKDLGFDS